MIKWLILVLAFIPSSVPAFVALSEIAVLQREMAVSPLGERIAFWAEKFVGTPYDVDPLGEYVRRNVIVADDRVDCMYLTFRAVELSLGQDPAGALQMALEKRFINKGIVENGVVLNYEDRFQYGEDMIGSGKWGLEVTAELGETERVEGTRTGSFIMAPGQTVLKNIERLQSGDIIFFINPGKRASREEVGHIGIIQNDAGRVYLIHASGGKNSGGQVKKVLFADYLRTMPFAGIRANRFPPD